MTLALAPRTAAAVPRMAAERPQIPTDAVGFLESVSGGLKAVWPCEPDEERVRFYLWASHHVSRSQDLVAKAWDALHEVAVLMSYIQEELDEFAQTGQVPHMGEDDMADLLPTSGSTSDFRTPDRPGSPIRIGSSTSDFRLPIGAEVRSRGLLPPTSNFQKSTEVDRSQKSKPSWAGSKTVEELAKAWSLSKQGARSRLAVLERTGHAVAERSRLANGGSAPTKWRSI